MQICHVDQQKAVGLAVLHLSLHFDNTFSFLMTTFFFAVKAATGNVSEIIK